MNTRKITGWAVLALVPAIWITLGVITHQLPEMIAGTVLALILIGLIDLGIKLIEPQEEK